MEICMHATHQAILCILFIVVSWADVNAQRHRSDEADSRRIREDTIGFDVVKETLEQLRITLEEIKQDFTKLENTLINHRYRLEQLEEDIREIKTSVTKQDKNTRALQETISSILHSQKEYEEVVDGFSSELAGVKHELVEDRNALDQKFMAPLEILNQTVQLLEHRSYEALLHQVAELKAGQQQQTSLALQKALQEMSQLRENYTSEIAVLNAEQKQQASATFELFEHSKKMEDALLELSQFRENCTSKVAELKAEQQQQTSLALQKALQEMSQLRENYTSEIAMLKAEQKKQAAAALELSEHSKNMEETLLEMSQFKENYTSKADKRVKRAISNKCSLNVRHKPEDGRIDVLMVMDPPDIDHAACN